MSFITVSLNEGFLYEDLFTDRDIHYCLFMHKLNAYSQRLIISLDINDSHYFHIAF